ncbi:hypothetical protein M569_15797, partial [Genlisea aurea]
LRRSFKRLPISDQQRRRQLSLERQAENRGEAQRLARCLAHTILSLQDVSPSQPQSEIELESQAEEPAAQCFDVRQAARLRGPEARRWFAKQLMLPEWMIDVPDKLATDWYVCARPAGKRCFVVSSNGITVSRLRNGSLLHRFPSALPNGARTNNHMGTGQSYCILDCIFHEPDQTYYVIDMVCWGGMSFYECTAEFRFFWLNSKLVETGACNEPSNFHKYRFRAVVVYDCDQDGLNAAYSGSAPYVKDGLLFCNKHSHYQPGNTPLLLVWKDANCSQYVIDTDGKGLVPDQQQVVLELLDDGSLGTSDDPPVIFGVLENSFVEKNKLKGGTLLRFCVKEGGLGFRDGELERAELEYVGKANASKAFADSYSKVVFQYMARCSPLRIEHI